MRSITDMTLTTLKSAQIGFLSFIRAVRADIEGDDFREHVRGSYLTRIFFHAHSRYAGGMDVSVNVVEQMYRYSSATAICLSHFHATTRSLY